MTRGNWPGRRTWQQMPLTDQEGAALRFRRLGYPYTKIAGYCGVSSSRAWRLVHKAAAKIQAQYPGSVVPV